MITKEETLPIVAKAILQEIDKVEKWLQYLQIVYREQHKLEDKYNLNLMIGDNFQYLSTTVITVDKERDRETYLTWSLIANPHRHLDLRIEWRGYTVDSTGRQLASYPSYPTTEWKYQLISFCDDNLHITDDEDYKQILQLLFSRLNNIF